MSNKLIKVDESGKTTAKELYQFLDLNPAHYARWCRMNIVQNVYAQEGVDWWGSPCMVNGNETVDYQLVVGFAKKLCMLSPTERGNQARNYFIEIEKRHKALTQPQSIEDLIIMQAQSMKEIRQRQEQQATILAEHSQELKQLEAKITTVPTEYFTIAGYANLRGLKIDVSKANLLGRKASKLSHEYGTDIGKCSDARFGQVNSYHIDILQEVFQELIT